jgi:glutamyl-tRNA synthetase
LHIGGARTALYNWLVARGGGDRGGPGTLVLRIEATDRERSTAANVEQILDALRWLELDWDEGPVSQNERAPRHRERLEELLASGAAYRDATTGAEVQEWRRDNPGRGYRGEPLSGADAEGAAVRLRVPDSGETIVDDALRGEIAFANALQDDPVIARADGSVLYNFAVAVDDADMGITDVIRGDDHLSNTPRQLLVLDALAERAPRYAHLPLLHGPDGKKLSKRHGAASVQELRDAGYLPAAVRNYLALLGWGDEGDETILGTDELVRRFSIERVGRSAAIFDERKLRWLNGRYMRAMPIAAYEAAVTGHLERSEPAAAATFGAAAAEARREACEIVRDKAQTLAEVWPLIRFLFEDPGLEGIPPKHWRKVMKRETRPLLVAAAGEVAEAEPFDAETLEALLRSLIDSEGVSATRTLQPIRLAATGSNVSPGIFESLAALGRERSLARLDRAIGRLGEGESADDTDPG